MWEVLENLRKQLQRLRVAQRKYSFIYPATGPEGNCSWYLVRGGQVQAAIREPRTRRPAEKCLAMIEQTYANNTLPIAEAMREDLEMTLLAAWWFGNRPKELQRTLSPAEAKERLRAILR